MRLKKLNEATGDPAVAFLRRTTLFASVSEDDLRWFSQAARLRRLGEGEMIVIEGSPGSAFFLLISGSATVSVQGEPVRALNPGDTFGEIAATTGKPRTATVTAATEVEVLGWLPWDLGALLRTNGEAAWQLAKQIARLVGTADAA